jgi:FKBP-type peptidyl-prolyl cis-trans isomerase
MPRFPRRIATAGALVPLALWLAGCPAETDGGRSDAPAAAAPGQVFENDDQKAVYAIGLSIAKGLATYDLGPQDLAWLQQGIADGVSGAEPKVDLAAMTPQVQRFAEGRRAQGAEKEKVEAAKHVEAAAAEAGATRSQSGWVLRVLSEGSGASPAQADTVKVHYHGTTRDGAVFDSSVERGQPATFPLGRVIPCWTQALQQMKVGGKYKLTCPSDVAYGDRGHPPAIKPGAALTFEIELLEIVAAPAAPPHG